MLRPHQDDAPAGGLRKAAISGSLWVVLGYGASQVLRLGGNLVLAWLLFPAAFGLMALVNVVLHGLTMLSDFGIGPSIIQHRRGDSREFLNTAWSVQIVRGFALWILTCLLAWPMAAFFAAQDELAWQLVALLPVAGFAAVLAGFNSTKLYTLNRTLQLRRLTAIELASIAIGVAAMIGWALLDRSIWALVAGGLVTAATKLALTHVAIPGQRVRVQWNRRCFRELFHFGKWVFLSTSLAFGAMHLDKVILGTMLTLGELGVYAIAFAFAKVAVLVCTRLSETVLFPVFSKFRDDAVKMVDIAIRSREIVLTVGAGVCLAFAIGSPVFFELLYDARYADAGVIAQWISLYMWTTILLQSMNRIPLALGNSRALFESNLLRCAGLLFAVISYTQAAVPGFIVGLAVGPVLAHAWLMRDVPLRRCELALQSLRVTAIAATYGGLAILAAGAAKQTGNVGLWVGATGGLIAAPLALCAWRIIGRVKLRSDSKNKRAPILSAGVVA